MLRTYRRGKGPITDRKFPRDLSQKIVDDLEVVTPDIGRTPIRRLSGGNVQKVLVGRETVSYTHLDVYKRQEGTLAVAPEA